MIDGILAEWFSKQPEEVRAAYGSNGIAYASLETMRASMTMLYEALRAEDIHIFHCRRVVNRMLYGVPEPDGVKALGERLRLLDDATFSISGYIDPEKADELAEEIRKLSAQQD